MCEIGIGFLKNMVFVLKKLLVYFFLYNFHFVILFSGCEIGFWCLCLKKHEFKFLSWGVGGSWERVSCALSIKLCWANDYVDMEKKLLICENGF